MKHLIWLAFLCVPAFSQCSITVIQGNQSLNSSRPVINNNFASLNVCKPQRFSGATVPGNIAGSLRGDFYQNTAANTTYQCFAVGPCTAVASGNWVLIGSTGGGSGTVTVVSSGNLTSTALVTGGGSQTLQTPCATCTLSSGGNLSIAGTFTTVSTDPGSWQPGGTVVASLPTCNSGADGKRMYVTNATATTFASIVAGGGSNHVPVYCNGTNWVIG